MIDILDHPESNHELIALRRDAKSGLSAIIAIHDSSLGPAIGGCRILPYPTSAAALVDVLRLSRGMTYKCAIAGIPYGGGKAVIVADPMQDKTPALLHAMGDFVESLGGRYIVSFDSGTTLEDIRVVAERTRFAAGIAEGYDNASASTALGVFHCMATAWRAVSGRDLAGARIAIQGLGNVGARLAALLSKAEAELIVADVDGAKVSAMRGTAAPSDRIHAADVDIFAPCALGAVLNERSIAELKARVVVGGANNQLATPEDANRLAARGILYCPDYLANAGGIIELHHQRAGSDGAALAAHVASLADTFGEVLDRATREGSTTAEVCDRMAEQRFTGAKP